MEDNLNDWLVSVDASIIDDNEKAIRKIHIKKNFDNSVPVILNLNHFALLTGIKIGGFSKYDKSAKIFL
ncbi:hypothetical protein JCM19314_1816 [Nonlabens ulvanivorans]|uniref:Uncharacterized protein n=1 Tax=Nonlabens ulvanivorans TaxID=906888 RepID=A0A090QG54_NONUL|nr:hypothetical protein [Nonlabens ulvanivorans]GAL00779.1 hypothetical protein JCM19314_1816 [Nonlabens ulvanivorans]